MKLAENVSRDSVESVFKMAELTIQATDNKFDDMLLPALPMLKEALLKQVDKISEDV